MGMDQIVAFPAEKSPAWPALVELLAKKSFPLQLRMIDGELAFPDETPPENWRELRVGTPGGMITLRRTADGITLTTWGNADANMRQAWNALVWAVAHLSGGKVHTSAGEMTLAEYEQTAELPAPFVGNAS
jgi:hypothetical protein